MIRRLTLILCMPALMLSACGTTASDSPKADSAILASTTFLADIAQNIAGDRQNVQSILPVGADPHSYQPTPRDLAKIESSGVILLNGADYEHFLEPILGDESGGKLFIEAAAGISPREDADGEHGVDPHMWLDPNLVMIYVENIRNGLTEYDPAGAEVYRQNANEYTRQLKQLDEWIKNETRQIPVEKRLLVTNHEALGYFAERYGFEIIGSVIPSFSANAEPSARQMAELVNLVKERGIPAIFLDAADNNTLARQIADETSVKVVEDLHLESLTNGPPAATYLEMMKHNVSRIVEALK